MADFRDPWARAPWREDRYSFERAAWSLCERLIVTRADATVFVTQTNQRDFARHHGPSVAARFHVIGNGCDPGDFDGLVPHGNEGKLVLLHAGSLYGARNPAALFRAVRRAIDSGAIDADAFRLRFVGRLGLADVDLPGLVRQLGLQQVVEFVPHMERKAVLREMVSASALLVVQPVTTVSVPGKLYEYFAAGRPVLALAEPSGETAELVRRSGDGVVVAAEDESAIERGLIDVMRRARGTIAPVDRGLYDGTLRATELEDLLVRVASSRPTAHWHRHASFAASKAGRVEGQP